MTEQKKVPEAVTDVLGNISHAQFVALIDAMMPYVAQQIEFRLRVRNDPWGNPVVSIR